MSEENSIEQLYKDSPLLKFSIYTHLQLNVLIELGDRILKALDLAFEDKIAGANAMQEVWGLFWLWVLGAYEVIRTMSQASVCFDAVLNTQIASTKRYLAKIRVPFAKQEYAGGSRNPRPIAADASISGWNPEDRDILYRVEEVDYSVRVSIRRLEDFLAGIEIDQILHNHRRSYDAC